MNKKIDITAPFSQEPSILVPVLIIAGLGITMVYSASANIALENHGTPVHYAGRQLLFFALGLGFMYLGAWFPHQYLQKLTYPLLVLAVVLMLGVLTPLGTDAGGASRWLKIKGITFQPSEPARLSLVLYLAYSLAAKVPKQEKIRSFFIGFLPHAMVMGLLTILLLLQKDMGSIVIICFITWSMMFIAGVPLTHLLSIVLPAIPFIYFFICLVEYRMERILTFIHPWQDPLKAGYQVTHSLKAFASGGVFGKGIGLGFQTGHYLPKPHTDFIFSVIGEELGLVGVLTILVLYSLILKRGADIARSASTLFGSFLAAGITIHLGLQVMINAGVTLGMLPTKGLTLPFISYGGTSLVMSMAAMGILMNIGRTGTVNSRKKATGPDPRLEPSSISSLKRSALGQTR
ncbi:putative lipid II flippase FtsW [Desulfocicer niacini]